MVKIVTDSVSDVPPKVAQELGITILPLYVHFGSESYRDGVDLSTEEFYHKLISSKTFPITSVSSPGEIAQAYDKLAEETDEILSIHLASKLSAFCEAATLAKEQMKRRCRVEVIDSLSATAGQGLIVIATAKAAQEGMSLDQLTEMVTTELIPRSHVRMVFDTLEYLRRGGRIGKAQALMGSVLRVHPIAGIKEGEGVVVGVGRERTRTRAVDWLVNYARSFTNIREMAVGYATTPDEAEALAQRLDPIFPREHIYMSLVGCVVGAHVGPHVLSVNILEGEQRLKP